MRFYSLTLPALALGYDNPEAFERTVTGDLYERSGLYLKTYAPEVLELFLRGDDAKVDSILSHGCHCAKLDVNNPYPDVLGGSTPVDALDELCRDWLRARNCNDNLVGGSCESNREAMRTGGYTMDINTVNYDNSNCGFTTSDCAADTCQIDVMYLKEIGNFMDNNPGHTATEVTAAGTCTLAHLDKRERKCIGEAPNVEPKRMSDLEQLYARIEYIEDNDEFDVVRYEEGGRHLNDNKEYIELSVHNQLITFSWDDVISFTVETVDDDIFYHVGWVERSPINNFAPGGTDTLGDNTKGGVRTVGISSGDATLRLNDGLEDPYDGPGNPNFYEAGRRITTTRNPANEEFQFFVDGTYIGAVSYSGWNNVFPAIDLQTQGTVRITDVIFETCDTGYHMGYDAYG